MTKFYVAPRPCVSCPYRLDTPSGVWSEEEYEKLRAYDEDWFEVGIPPFAAFHCHQESATGVDTVCRGWLTVAQESVAARIAVADGRVTVDELYAEPLVALRSSIVAKAAVNEFKGSPGLTATWRRLDENSSFAGEFAY